MTNRSTVGCGLGVAAPTQRPAIVISPMSKVILTGKRDTGAATCAISIGSCWICCRSHGELTEVPVLIGTGTFSSLASPVEQAKLYATDSDYCAAGNQSLFGGRNAASGGKPGW
jgi:hypothetical protein